MENHPELAHFIKLASRGAKPAASGGEKRAYRIARAIIDNIQGLDGQAIDGIRRFVTVAELNNSLVHEIIGEATNV